MSEVRMHLHNFNTFERWKKNKIDKTLTEQILPDRLCVFLTLMEMNDSFCITFEPCIEKLGRS